MVQPSDMIVCMRKIKIIEVSLILPIVLRERYNASIIKNSSQDIFNKLELKSIAMDKVNYNIRIS